MGILCLSEYCSFLEMKIQLESPLFTYDTKQNYLNELNMLHIEIRYLPKHFFN